MNVGVYSVGIFSGANTSVTSCNWRSDETCKANVFMNAVSSNYPNYGSVAWDNSSGVTLSGGSNKATTRPPVLLLSCRRFSKTFSKLLRPPTDIPA